MTVNTDIGTAIDGGWRIKVNAFYMAEFANFTPRDSEPLKWHGWHDPDAS